MRAFPLLLALSLACNQPPDEARAPGEAAIAPSEVPSVDPAADVDPGPDTPITADPAAAGEHRARAFQAYEAGDFDGVVRETRAALQADPTSTVDRYNLACGLALTGDRDGALGALRTLLDEGVDYGVATDPDFAALRDDPDFQDLVARFDALYPTIAHSERVRQVTDRMDLAPDGLAHDPATGRFFVSSMRSGIVYAIDGDGAASPFATLSVDGTPVSAMGLAVDAERGTLWAVGTAFSLHEAYDDAHRGTTALFALDLASGEISGVHPVDDPQGLGLHDVGVAPDGTVYTTGGALRHVTAEGHLEPVALEKPLARTDGIAISPEGVVYVSAERKGIAKVEPDAGSWSWLEVPADLDLRHFDGLAWSDGSLAGLQLGLDRWRAVRVDLDEAGNTVVGLEVLEQGNPEIAFATSGVVVDGHLHYVGRSPLPEGVDRASVGPAAGQTALWRAPVAP